MKIVLNLFLSILLSTTLFAQDHKKVFLFEIKEEIAPPVWRTTQNAFDQAKEQKADVILIQMNTYGGQVDLADSIRTRILYSKIPVYVLIENNAASAGALISIACDSIYMKPGSTIGAATVVNQNGEQVPDKYQSYMRKKMRATAEETGRNPDIAEAMVDPDKVVKGVNDSGKVITFSVTEAIQHGFCEAELNNYQEVLKRTGLENAVIIKQEITYIDKIVHFLLNPMISGILIMLIMGGIYFELQTPGIGFPLIAAIVGAVLYFAPHYLEGLTERWEILVFLIGLGLLAVELFVIPGFGIAGISGITMMVIGLVLSMIGNVGFDFNFVGSTEILGATALVLISGIISISLSFYLASKLITNGIFQKYVLQAEESKESGYVASTDLSALIGKTGTVSSFMRPSGKVEIEGEVYDAASIHGVIEKGESVKVLRVEGAQVYVEKIQM